MIVEQFRHIVWCDIEIALLKIYSYYGWRAKRICLCKTPDLSKQVINIFLCDSSDSIFMNCNSYREKNMERGIYIGHHFGEPVKLKLIDDYNIAIACQDPDKILWCYVIKYVLTVFANKSNILHIKGSGIKYKNKAFLFLGRGGSGKTEIVQELCKSGAAFFSNTHILLNKKYACGIKSNIRVRENRGERYVPFTQLANTCDGWLPVGAIFWVNYRTDSRVKIEKISEQQAFLNLQFFSEAITNWEMKEDFADYVNSDPFAFADYLNRIYENLREVCQKNKFYYLNLNIHTKQGIAGVTKCMENEL